MTTRRTAIIRALSVFASLVLSSRKAPACVYPSDNPDSVNINIPKNNLMNFYFGKIEDYLHREYADNWTWSDDVEIHSYRHRETYSIVENSSAVPITISHNMRFDNLKLYCSNIDFLYIDDDDYELRSMYSLVAIRFKHDSIPFFSTRIRMTSNKAKIYGAATFRNIDNDEISHVQISNSPINIKQVSCNVEYHYWYTDT